jgi:lipopolysaccharide/colanic/teichoic acid biosynthesis glycosyltransferase
MPTLIDETRPSRDIAVALHAGDAFDAAVMEDFGRAHPLVIDRRRADAVERRRQIVRALEAGAKRTIDFLFALTVLLLTLPIIAIVAAAIVIESPGPVFFRAERVGLNGRRLRMLKFRKMHHNATGLPLTSDDDDRFTRLGRFLSRAKLDEVPQLWHVLKGEMSLIGPRPEDPRFVAERPADYDEILRVRPGVTGLSQIAFAEESAILCKEDPISHYRERIFPQKIRLDRMYAGRPSLAMDFQIIFWTAAAVMLRRQVAVHRGTGKMNLRRR